MVELDRETSRLRAVTAPATPSTLACAIPAGPGTQAQHCVEPWYEHPSCHALRSELCSNHMFASLGGSCRVHGSSIRRAAIASTCARCSWLYTGKSTLPPLAAPQQASTLCRCCWSDGQLILHCTGCTWWSRSRLQPGGPPASGEQPPAGGCSPASDTPHALRSSQGACMITSLPCKWPALSMLAGVSP